MEQLQIADGDMLALHIRDMVGNTELPAEPRTQQQYPSNSSSTSSQEVPDPETIRLRVLGNPQLRESLAGQNPELAAAVDDPVRFRQTLARMNDTEAMERQRRRQHIADLNNDPFDVEAQQKIEEMIREERVQENLQNAIEHNPEGLCLQCSSTSKKYHTDHLFSIWPRSHALH